MTTSQVAATLLALGLGLGLSACSEATANPGQPTLNAVGASVADSAQHVADVGKTVSDLGARSATIGGGLGVAP